MKNKYKIIYCDPPWQYKNQKTRAVYTVISHALSYSLVKTWVVGTLGVMSVRMIFSYKNSLSLVWRIYK